MSKVYRFTSALGDYDASIIENGVCFKPLFDTIDGGLIHDGEKGNMMDMLARKCCELMDRIEHLEKVAHTVVVDNNKTGVQTSIKIKREANGDVVISPSATTINLPSTPGMWVNVAEDWVSDE